jgi:hypothetical protein
LERYIEESAEDRLANKLTDHINTFLEFTEDYMQTLRDQILCLIFKLAARDDAELSKFTAMIEKTEQDVNNTNLIIQKVYKNPTYTKFSKKGLDGLPKTRRCLRKEIFAHVRLTEDPSTLIRSENREIVRKSTSKAAKNLATIEKSLIPTPENSAPAPAPHKYLTHENSNTPKHPVKEKLIIAEQTESSTSSSSILTPSTNSNPHYPPSSPDQIILEIDRQKLQSLMDQVKVEVLNQYSIHTSPSSLHENSRQHTTTTKADSGDKLKVVKSIFETKYKMTKEEIQDFQNFYALLWYYYWYDIERYKV